MSWAGANLKGRVWGKHKYEFDALSDVCDVCSTPQQFSVRPEETEFCSPVRGIGRDQSQGSQLFHQAGGRKADCRGEGGAGEESGGWISLLGVGGQCYVATGGLSTPLRSETVSLEWGQLVTSDTGWQKTNQKKEHHLKVCDNYI